MTDPAVLVSPNALQDAGLSGRLDHALPLPRQFGDGVSMFRHLAGLCSNFDSTGRAMAWMLFNMPRLALEGELCTDASLMVFGKAKVNFAMHRGPVPRHRALFPLPLGDFDKIKQLAKHAVLDDFLSPHFAGLQAEEVWSALAVLGLNGAAGYGRADLCRRATELQKTALGCIRQSTKRVLSSKVHLERSAEAAEKELSTRFLTYTGEEVPKMQVLSVKAAKPALPPSTHGGSIDARSLVSDGTRWFLRTP